MKRVDAALAALGVVAAVVLVVAFLEGDAWAGVESIRYDVHEEPLTQQGPLAAGGGGALFAWTAPNNATGANFTVYVEFRGSALEGGAATVSIEIIAPDGSRVGPEIHAFPIAQQSSMARANFTLDSVWMETPPTVTDEPEAHEDTTIWQEHLKVRVAVSPPSDLPLASYTFYATVAGAIDSYHRA